MENDNKAVTGKLIKIGYLQLEYFVYGSGDETVVCLHGHGRKASDFQFIASENRKVISIHLFHHGNSTFPEVRIEIKPLQTQEFKDLFQLILDTESVVDFHLFAFSQGGRFSLCMIPFYGKQLKSITLIAPDGMDNNSFYNWSSRQKWARKLFKKWEKDPSKIIAFSNVVTKIRLMRPKVKEFVQEFASDKKSFKRASLTWRTFRAMIPDYDKISDTITENNIPFLIIMGSYDQVIRPQQAKQFVKKLGLENSVVEIENGHNFFKKTSIKKFINLLPFMEQ